MEKWRGDGHSCGVAVRANGDREVVVVGGRDGPYRHDVVEIFSLKTMQWRIAAARFPIQLETGAVVRHRDSFLVVGGYSAQDSAAVNTIYRHLLVSLHPLHDA